VSWINGRTISIANDSISDEPYPGYDGRGVSA